MANVQKTPEELIAVALKESTPIVDTISASVNDQQMKFAPAQIAQLLATHGTKFYEGCYNIQDAKNKQTHPMTLSAVLEHIMAADESKLSAFDRMLMYHRIPVLNVSDRGIYAANMDLFFRTPSSTALVPEFINRVLRKQVEEEYSLGDMVAELIMTPNGSYKQPKLDLTNISAGMGRTAEYARSPKARLAFTEDSKTVGERSIALEVSYRAMRHIPINLFTLFLKRVAMADSEDLVGMAVETLETAAGTPTAKATVNNADTGTLSMQYKTWLNMCARSGGHKWDRGVCKQATAIAILTMARPNPDFMQMMSAIKPGDAGINAGVQLQKKRWTPCELIDHETAASQQLTLFDRAFALLHIKEIGVSLTETDRIIDGGFEQIVVRDSDDFCVFDSTAVKAYNAI